MMRRVVLLALSAGLLAWTPAPETDLEGSWAGRWAMEMRIASVARIPLIGDQHSVTTSWMLVDLQQEGTRWVQRHQVCDVRVHGNAGGARLIVPPAFVRSLPARVYPVSLAARKDRGSYLADMGVELIGLERSFSGASLPRNAQHPGVRDTDGDGAPGATIEMQIPALGRVKLYVVQRSHLVLNGRRTPDGAVRGAVDFRVQEQRTIGARPGLLGRSPAIRPVPARSEFTLVRVPGTADCAELGKAREALFSDG